MAAPEAGLTAPALQIRALTKSYGNVTAVAQVDLTVSAGEFVALLGPSGAGKSTIFRCVTRLVAPDAGEVDVLGRRMDNLSGRALRMQRRSIGLIFQQFNLIERLSALDNVLAGRLGATPTWRAVLRRFPQSDRQLALAALDRVGLLEKAYQRADRLSGGQQQRVAIARVLAQESRIILADEPVASLDPSAADNVLGILRSVARERGIAVLCSLHQTAFAQRYADRIVALRAGKIISDTAAADLGADEIRRIYGAGDELAIEAPALPEAIVARAAPAHAAAPAPA
jgi:phosphonate transport system ATP-binding protein